MGSKDTDVEDEEDEEDGEEDHPSFFTDGEASEGSWEEEEEEALFTDAGGEMDNTPDENEGVVHARVNKRSRIESDDEENNEAQKENTPPGRPKRARIVIDEEAYAEGRASLAGSDFLDLPPIPSLVLSPITTNTNTPVRMECEDPIEAGPRSKGLTREDYAALERVWKESEPYLQQARKKEEAKKKKGKQRPDHVCGERYCKRCKTFHNKRRCYISARPRAEKDRRIIVYDFESTQTLRPDPLLERFQHQVKTP